ncbi:dihydrolipoamide succinyltransferase [Phaffia rhodozyma]|uniref:dihydrolipoyllysine-residue succinyltransferase n=1 Tax=Phaffia rhodozyma TaxID=264483 RepID=A0A0F7SFI2_PHARH|nr:dihydrolipoamide succinyltransferase [Phaffia rhodozyma]
MRIASQLLKASKPIQSHALLASKVSAASLRQFSSSLVFNAERVKVPTMAESITEGTLKTWSKQVGEFVKQDEEIATIETDKIDVTVNAPFSGKILELLAEEESTVTVGEDLFVLEAGEEEAGSSEAAAEPPTSSASEPAKEAESGPKKTDGEKAPEPAKAAPAAQDKPSSPKERQESAPKKESPPKAKKEEKPVEEAVRGARTETRVKMNRMRLRIAERLKESQNSAASLTTFNEIDMSALMEFRSLYKDQVLKEQGVKLGFMSAFARASVLALKEIPAANASIEGPNGGDTIVYRDYVDLSVAVATPKGLVTPVVRNVETLGLVQIEKAIADLGVKARDGKLTMEDMSGGSFTISNGGVFGSLFGTPIINLPQAAVLGMHNITQRAVVVNGQVVARPVMIVALTYDHRLLDGREAVSFLVKIKQYIEDPRKMLLSAL